MANQVILGNVRGKKGGKGDTGATPDIAVALRGLPAGSTPTVSRSGTNENPVLTFNMPALDQGTVVVFNMNSERTTATTSANFANIYSLISNKENVRFFVQVESGSYWELNYFYSVANYLTFEFNNGNFAIKFRWDANGVNNFIYGVDSIAFWTAETLASW